MRPKNWKLKIAFRMPTLSLTMTISQPICHSVIFYYLPHLRPIS